MGDVERRVGWCELCVVGSVSSASVIDVRRLGTISVRVVGVGRFD